RYHQAARAGSALRIVPRTRRGPRQGGRGPGNHSKSKAAQCSPVESVLRKLPSQAARGRGRIRLVEFLERTTRAHVLEPQRLLSKQRGSSVVPHVPRSASAV